MQFSECGIAMELSKALGTVFSKARKAAHLTQEDFEPLSPRTYISHLERGLSSVTLSKLDELSKVIGVHPASLVFQAYIEYDKNVSALDLMAMIMEDLKKLGD